MRLPARLIAAAVAIAAACNFAAPRAAHADDTLQKALDIALKLLQDRNRGNRNPGSTGINAPPPATNALPGNTPPAGYRIRIENYHAQAIEFKVTIDGIEQKIGKNTFVVSFSPRPITITYVDGYEEQTISAASGTYAIGVANGRWVLAPTAGSDSAVGKFKQTVTDDGLIWVYELKADGGYSMWKFLSTTTDDKLTDGNHESRLRGDKYTYIGGKLTFSPTTMANQIGDQEGPYTIATTATGLTLTPAAGSARSWQRLGGSTPTNVGVVGRFKQTGTPDGLIWVYDLKADGSYTMWTFVSTTTDANLTDGNHENRLRGDRYTYSGGRLTLSPASAANQTGDQDGPFTVAATGNGLKLTPTTGSPRYWTKLGSTPQPTPTGKPAKVTITGPTGAVSTATATITWSPSAGAAQYEIWAYNKTRGMPLFHEATAKKVSDTRLTFTLEFKRAGDFYQVFVRGVSATGAVGDWGVHEFQAN